MANTSWEQSEIAVTQKLRELADRQKDILNQLLILHGGHQRTRMALYIIGGIFTTVVATGFPVYIDYVSMEARKEEAQKIEIDTSFKNLEKQLERLDRRITEFITKEETVHAAEWEVHVNQHALLKEVITDLRQKLHDMEKRSGQ